MDTFELDIAGENFRESPLYSAIKSRDATRVLRSIHTGENIRARDPDFNSTYLHLTVHVANSVTEVNLVPVVYQLSNAGVEVDAVDYKGQTALDLALRKEMQLLAAALLRVGADPSMKDYQGIVRELRSPFQLELLDILYKYDPGLWTAVAEDDYPTVQILVYSWCRVNIYKNGISLINYARTCGASPDILGLLDEFQVTMEFVHATLAGDEKRMLEFLMDDKPCDPYIMDISHQEMWSAPLAPKSLRDTAMAMGHQHILCLLPEDDLDMDDDVKGYFGGVTLEDTIRSQRDKSRIMKPLKKSSSYGDTSNAAVNSKIPPLGPRILKSKPMKAFAPQTAISTTTPDIIPHSSVPATNGEDHRMDLLNNAKDHSEQSYEQSRFTGSVALRSKNKSRRPVREVYSFTDDWPPTSDKQDDSDSELTFSDIKKIEHIATPRGRQSPSLSDGGFTDYSRNWVRSSLKASLSKSKARTKEIRSKMCVIS